MGLAPKWTVRGAKPTRKAAKGNKALELAFRRGRLTVKVLRGLKEKQQKQQTLLRIAIANEKRERVRKQNRVAEESGEGHPCTK